MKHISFIIFILTIASFHSCQCPECTTPPQSFYFQIKDKNTDEDLFTNGTFDKDQIKIIDNIVEKIHNFNLIEQDSSNFIEIYSIGWVTEIADIDLYIGDEKIFNLYVDAERKSEDCCSFTSYNEITLSDCEFDQDFSYGIYSIYY